MFETGQGGNSTYGKRHPRQGEDKYGQGAKGVLQRFPGEHHFAASTGYGYDDMGREKLEEIYAKAFGAESALVRIQMVSGTHALAVALFGCLRPDDLLVSVTGTPYDTMTGVIGHAIKSRGSLTEYKVRYDEIALGEDGKPNLYAIAEYLSGNKARMVMVQRSRGYAWRDSLSISDIEAVVQCVKSVSPDTIVFVDNCYGEFTDTLEPTAVGADIMAGSLIRIREEESPLQEDTLLAVQTWWKWRQRDSPLLDWDLIVARHSGSPELCVRDFTWHR